MVCIAYYCAVILFLLKPFEKVHTWDMFSADNTIITNLGTHFFSNGRGTPLSPSCQVVSNRIIYMTTQTNQRLNTPISAPLSPSCQKSIVSHHIHDNTNQSTTQHTISAESLQLKTWNNKEVTNRDEHQHKTATCYTVREIYMSPALSYNYQPSW